MHSLSKRLIILIVVIQCLQSCSVWQPPKTVEPQAQYPAADLRALAASDTLAQLENVDVLVKFNNHLLADEIKNSLSQHLSGSENYVAQTIKVEFKAQLIHLSAQWRVLDDRGEMLKATTTGEIQLAANGQGLEWFANFNEIHILPTESAFGERRYAQSTSDLSKQLLQQINSRMQSNLPNGQIRHIAFQPVPLASIAVGTQMPPFNNASSTQSAPVKGMFFVTGSATLIEPETTTILLDMDFKPNLATCPADISVSRAMFTNQINDREPVGILQNMDDTADLQFFYSEISATTRPMTIIHYWFANGKPVAVEELPVGPSDRWRTWSSKGDIAASATHWQVLVVDKDSGCVLRSASIRTTGPEAETHKPSPTQYTAHYANYQNEFIAKTYGFPSARLQPLVGITEIRSAFYQQVIQAGIEDMQIETAFNEADLPERMYQADLLPFKTQHVVCEKQECTEPLVCNANIAHCKRLRDTRECSSCLFRNPLNNRCVQMEEDPICVAAKNRQNYIYETEREECIAAADVSRQGCQQLNVQISQSCEIETRAEKSACEASKVEIESLGPGDVLAKVRADSQVGGQISTVFSKFVISGDFQQLQQDVTLKARLSIQGKLDFEPASDQWPLNSCINAWKGNFSNSAISSTRLNSMLTPLMNVDGSFTAVWSGVVLPLGMTTSPLESVFVSSPQLLAACSIGLTVHRVEQAILGEHAGFFKGALKLIIQPLPTRIDLDPAYIDLAGGLHMGKAHINEGFISYKMGSGETSIVQ